MRFVALLILRAIPFSSHDDGSEIQFLPSVEVRAPQSLRESRSGSGCRLAS
jgi:hypothetical protein